MSRNAKLRRVRYWKQKKLATPAWATGMGKIYREMRRQRKMGRDVCVDHIVPLNSALVCGLHCADNLQIMTVQENSKKSNFWWPDAPFEQIEMERLHVAWHQAGLL